MNPKPSVYFVSGIDTGVGKTVATGIYARELAAQGRRVSTQKVVQTGCSGIAEDILVHRLLQNQGLTRHDHSGASCPYVFSYPCSPHLAAEREGREISPVRIDAATAHMLKDYDTILLEGAGGLMVPLTRNLTLLDFAAERGYPLVLVSNGRLGSINHTLLSFSALKQYGISLHSLIFNHIHDSRDEHIAQDSLAYLKGRLKTDFPDAEWMELDKVETDERSSEND